MYSTFLIRLCLVIPFVLFVAAVGHVVKAQGPEIDTFTGDTRTACEAVMCLSSGERPHECDAPLKKFFSIKAKKPWKTIKKRKNFLELCPSGDYENRQTHLTALAEGAGRCDMDSLLGELNVASPPYTKAIPTYCSTLVSHEYTTAYDLPVRVEHCSTDHLGDLGPEPRRVFDWVVYDGYSDEPPLLNAAEIEAYQQKERLQANHPTPICVSRWHDPVEAAPLDELDALLVGEVERIDAEIVLVLEYSEFNY
jgi:hypothetical protein